MENLDSPGERLAKEMRDRFNLTNQATEQMARDIDSAIASGLRLDAWLRLPPGARKTPDKPTKYTKPVRSEVVKVVKTIEYKAPKAKPAATQTTEQSERNEALKLRKELAGILKDDFPGRTYSQDTQIKINRLKLLEKKYDNL
ncbi:MAG TPA: hypothetical protein VD905_06255 [Flavobacteriales bacterium]|nr:hypothetical protein [Flavobacteriales bacterium]